MCSSHIYTKLSRKLFFTLSLLRENLFLSFTFSLHSCVLVVSEKTVDLKFNSIVGETVAF